MSKKLNINKTSKENGMKLALHFIFFYFKLIFLSVPVGLFIVAVGELVLPILISK